MDRNAFGGPFPPSTGKRSENFNPPPPIVKYCILRYLAYWIIPPGFLRIIFGVIIRCCLIRPTGTSRFHRAYKHYRIHCS